MTLTEKLEHVMRERSLARTTRSNYHGWVKAFYQFNRTPASQWTGEMLSQWLGHLHRLDYSAGSRKQALCAVVFVFRHVLQREIGNLNLPPMPRVRQTLRVVPSREELGRIFAGLKGQAKLMAGLMYGSGLRVNECCHLRVKDVDLPGLTVNVWDGKGAKCRRTVLPVMLGGALQRHLAWRKALHDQDVAAGQGLVELPGRLAQKYRKANREFTWQWLFPSTVLRGQYRWHATDEMVAKQMREAVRAAGITKRITPHCLRHAFATDAMRAGNDIRTVQELLGHEDMNTTAIYTHGDTASGVSPLDVGMRPMVALPALEFA
jgi:integron integrase